MCSVSTTWKYTLYISSYPLWSWSQYVSQKRRCIYARICGVMFSYPSSLANNYTHTLQCHWQNKRDARNDIYVFYVHVTVHRNKFLFNKTNRCTNFPNLFWLKNEPLHISDSSSAHHQKFVNCTLGTGIWHTDWNQLTNRAGMELLVRWFQSVWHIYSTFFTWCFYFLCAILGTVFVLRVLLSSYVYLLYLMFICGKRMCIFYSYVYLLYLMFICCILCLFVVSYVYLC
jgi:hypothetical protein